MVVVGLVARRVAGPRAGLIAAGIAAIYPQLWINDGMLISESMYVLMIALTLLCAYRLWDSRRWTDAVLLGGVIGLSALTRPEAVFLVPLIGVPFLFSKRTPFRQRCSTLLVIGGVCLVVILPWWVRNLTEFEKPSFLATGNGVVLQVSNCDGTYSGQFLGYWDVRCLTADAPPENAEQRRILHGTDVPGLAYLDARNAGDDSVFDTQGRDKAFHYMREHLSRVPIVVAARIGRVWGIFRPEQDMNFDIFFERRGTFPARSGAYMYYALVPFAVYALVIMRRRRIPISPMIAMFVLVTFTVAIAMGITRYRVGADLTLTVLGGIAVDGLLRRFLDRAPPRRSTPPSAPTPPVASTPMPASDPPDRTIDNERNTELLRAELPAARYVDERVPPLALRREPLRAGHPTCSRRRRSRASRTTH